MKSGLFVLIFCTCGLVTTSIAEKVERYTEVVMPDNVTLGMTRDALQAARPVAKHLAMAVGSRNTNAVVLTEMQGETLPLVFYQYHFIDNRLRAITKGIGYGNGRDEQTSKRVHDVFIRDLKKQANENILRLNTELEQVPAEMWTDEDSGACIYFVDTSNELTVITFDPRYFQKKDFFMSPDEMPKIAPALETVRKSFEALKKPKQATDKTRIDN